MYDFARYLNVRSATNPVLSPDGSRLAFLTDSTGNFQVWSVDLRNQAADPWPRQLTFFPDKVWDLHGSPATGALIAVSDVGGNERQQFYLITNYGIDDGGELAHDVRRLTTADQAIHRFGAWSKDGTRILYTSNERNGVDFDLYQMELDSGKSECIAEVSGNRVVADWAPDGSAVLMLSAEATEQHELYRVDLPDGQETHITAGQPHARYMALKWTESGIYTLTDRGYDTLALCRLDLETAALEEIVPADSLLALHEETGGELEALSVAPDARQGVLVLNVEGYSHLYRVDLQSGDTDVVDGVPRGVIHNVKFGAGGKKLVFDLQSPVRNPNIWLVDAETGAGEQVTFSDHAGINRSTFVEPELVHFPTFDDRQIPAFYYRPQSAPPEAGYPCILYVHGGPASQQRPDFDVRFQYFLNRGYALLVTNVRGSTGYGRTYMMLDDLELRMDSVADLKHAVAWLHGRSEINGDAIAIYGRSYGGFMVLAAVTEYPELFAAAIDVVGIGNWVTFLERTSAWRRGHRSREYGSLENHRELLERISPIHKAHLIQAPLLVLAGDNDPRVPLYESEQIVDRVRNAGGTVEFIHYADEGHRFSKLSNRIDSFTQMARFLDEHLGMA